MIYHLGQTLYFDSIYHAEAQSSQRTSAPQREMLSPKK